MNHCKLVIVTLLILFSNALYAQNDDYKDLIDDDKPVEAALSFFKKDSLSEINIYGNFSDRNLLIYSSKKDVMDSIRNGNIGLLLGLANTKHLTGLDLAFSYIDESKIKEAKEAFYYFKIISVFLLKKRI